MDSNSVQVLVSATSPEEIAAVNERLHDHVFRLDDVAHDGTRLTISYADELPENSQVVRKGLFKTTYSIPRFKALLEVENILSVTIEDKSEVGTYEFAQIRLLDPNELVIEAEPSLRVVIQVRNLRIVVRRTSEPLEARHVKSLFGGVAEITKAR
jgi:hypothetical protein